MMMSFGTHGDDELRYSWDREGWSQIWLQPRLGRCVYKTQYVVRVYFDERDRVRKIERSQYTAQTPMCDF
jgi:hypothetical protein